MNPDVLLGLQMNAPPNETTKSTITSSAEREATQSTKESKPSFRSLLAKRCRQADSPSNDPPCEQITRDEGSFPASADSTVSSKMVKAEEETTAQLMPTSTVLIDWGALNVPFQWPCSTFPGDKGEIGLQNLPMVDLDHGGSGQPLNIPTQSLSAPKPTSNGTAGSFAAEKAQPTTQGERNAPETLKEHTAAFSKVQLTLQTGRGVVAEESNQPQQAIEIPETVPISAHIRTADLGEAATFVQSLMSTAKARTVVSADQLIRQTFRAVEMMVRLDQSNLHLQLYPESLGRIEIRISQGTEGTHVWMVADQPQTERLLQTGLNELRQSLIHAGIQLADVAVGGQNAHTNLFRQPQGSPMRLQVPLDAISPEVNTEDHRVSRIGASDSYVDYRI